jgi:hypothetical protein
VGPEAIEAVVRELQPNPYGWGCELPAPFRFFGRTVELRVDTREYPTDDPTPSPDPDELELVRLILGGLPGVLIEAERQYAEYNADFPDLIERAHEPHIWIARNIRETDGPDHWSFIVGIADAPDWGIHIEFQGLEFQRIWSGD